MCAQLMELIGLTQKFNLCTAFDDKGNFLNNLVNSIIHGE